MNHKANANWHALNLCSQLHGPAQTPISPYTHASILLLPVCRRRGWRQHRVDSVQTIVRGDKDGAAQDRTSDDLVTSMHSHLDHLLEMACCMLAPQPTTNLNQLRLLGVLYLFKVRENRRPCNGAQTLQFLLKRRT